MTVTDLLANAVPVDVEKPEQEDVRMWSVTTIIGALDKPALVPWAANMTAEEAVRVYRRLPSMIEEDGPEETAKWLASARFRKPKGQKHTASEMGTAVHDALEKLAITGERPTDIDPAVIPYLDQFTRWAQKAQPEYLAAEMTVYDTRYGYAGTLDAIAVLRGERLIMDYKTTSKPDEPKKVQGPYGEAALQLAAYRYAEFAAAWRPRRVEQHWRRYYLLGPEERDMAVPVPEVDGAVVVHVTPTHCHAHPARADREVHTKFLYAIEAAGWVYEMSKTVIGAPLMFDGEAA